jgi:hypothetical protein
MGPVSIDEAPVSLEDAFVSYLGGSIDNARLPEEPQALELAGGVA